MLIRTDFLVIRNCIQFYQKTSSISSIDFSLTSSSLTTISTSIIRKLFDHKEYRQVLDLFAKQTGIPSDYYLNLTLKACTELRDYQCGRKIHKQLSSNSLKNPFIQCSLIHFYMQCKDINNAIHVFSTSQNKTNPIYGAMFKGFISNQMPEKFFELLNQMKIEPDEINLTFIFNACAQLNNDQAVEIGKKYLREKFHVIKNNRIILNTAIHMLMTFSDFQQAEKLFEMIIEKDIFTYGAMIKGYVQNDMYEKALNLYEEMPLNPNDIIYTTIFSACSQFVNERTIKIGQELLNKIHHRFQFNQNLFNSALNMLIRFNNIEHAEHLFKLIKKKDAFTYTIMINGYNLNDQPLKSLEIFDEMKQNNVTPDEALFTIIINTCAQIGILSKCQSIVDQIPSNLLHKQYIYCSLIDMWGKVGSIENAKKLFESIPKNDAIATTTMINAYGLNGMGLEAIHLYQQMPKHLRNEVSHLCVLNACSHSALLHHAQTIFDQIPIKTEKIIAVMIDCLSRLFFFDEAQKLLDNYEISHPPSLSMYMAILSGARNCRNSILSEKIYHRMELLFPDRKQNLLAASILLENTYSSMGKYKQANLIRSNRIKYYGNQVKIGLSWTEVNGQIVHFKAHDRSHPQSEEIYKELDRISEEILQHGHAYDSSWITRPLKENETVTSVLCGHSERLAIAFNLIQQPSPTVIQITENIRICGDCHRVIKLIAQIRQCQIIVRDANRIHHFQTNGQCSCQDHF